ncbi:signal peptidase I [Blastococcus sp. TF02A-30]|uniref:signal peptidase I n=1 Tax=Blastococcus sp. TF02A-30 TaxID=2250580 RepID=UPI000DEA2128|nr:signal peptidase I [Blastococcus sp. TF02A-30]RBY92528.1 signal peptidase I [Blastococcus sp. TF02A-30]
MPLPRIARLSGAVAVLLAAVWLLLPTELGGSTTYVTTHGNSMEPDFRTGDLAILRPAATYGMGDVVAYDSAQLGTTVMHRIIDRDDHRFVTRGDNNSWIDPDEPTSDEILGELWFSIPQGGKALAAMRSPWVLAVVALAVTTLVSAGRRPRGRHSAGHAHRRPGLRLPRLHRRAASPAPRASGLSAPLRARARQLALGSAVAAVLAAGAGAATFVLPAAAASAGSVDVVQQGAYGYTATAAPSTTYPTGALGTGDPVYTRLVEDLTVSFEDVVTGADVAGTVRLDVAIEAPDGWTAPVTSGTAAPVQDGTATAAVLVDHVRAAQLLERHNAEVGAAGVSATLVLTPVVEMTATVDGAAATLDQPEPLRFSMDPTALRVAGETTALTPAVTTQLAVGGAAATSDLEIAGVTLPLGPVRLVAAAVLVLAVATAVVAGLLGRGRGGEADEFLVRHAARVLPVTSFAPGNTVIDVADAEALHRLAERLEVLVLHHAGPHADTFAVQDGDTTYRCVVPRVGEAHVAAARRSPAGGLLRRFA